MKKTILILAASQYQLPIIKKALSLNCRVLTSDNRPDNPGHALAHQSFNIDTTDVDGISELARSQRIDGILAPATDVAVISAAKAARALGLPGPPPLAAETLTNKILFREFLLANKIPCPEFTGFSEAGPEIGRMIKNGPWLVKPNRSSGSKGIFIIDDQSGFERYAPEALKFSLDGQALAERFISGSQHTCEGFLEGGKIKTAMITDRLTAPAPYVATRGHLTPHSLPPGGEEKAFKLFELIFEKLNLTDGPFDADFVYSQGEPYVLEMTPRLGGNSLSQLYSASLGVDLIALAIGHACGVPIEVRPHKNPRPAAAIILGLKKPGRAVWNEAEAEKLAAEDWVLNLSFDIPHGADAEAFINGRHRLGEVLIAADSRQSLDSRINEFSNRLDLSSGPANDSQNKS